MTILPTLQRRIRSDYFRLVIVFGIFGLLLVGAVFAAGRMPKLLVSMNYDSIASVREMETAMNGLRFPGQYPEKNRLQWKTTFDAALLKASDNITEPGEAVVLERLKRSWASFQHSLATSTTEDEAYKELRLALSDLVQINEQGMIERVNHNALMQEGTILGAAVLFALATLWAIFMADSIAGKVAHPLRRSAETFKDKPKLGAKLSLPSPQTLEVRILFDELERLWSRLSELDAVNVGNLMAEKRKLEVILESADDAILVLDASGGIAHMSQRMVPLLGLDRELAHNAHWLELGLSSPNYQTLHKVLNSSLEGKMDVVLMETEERIFSARRRDLISPEGQSVGQVFLLGDVTELRRRESLRSELMDWVSHELKTPMQSLCLASDLLYRQKDTFHADTALLLETIHEDVARLRNLSQQFLDIARMTPAALQLRQEQVNLPELLERCLRSLRILAEENNVRLTIRQDAELPLVNIDTERFSWVISNLVTNALRASSAGEEITLSMNVNDHNVHLEVEDNGSGVPDSMKNRLFEPFSHGRTAGSKSGLFGLGLAITRSIVNAHGGSIGHEAVEPHGSRFTVTLPIKSEEHHAD